MNGYNSDELDEPEEAPKPKKRKLTKSAEAKLKAKAKAKAKKAKDDDDDDDDHEDDACATLVKDSYRSARPPIGNFENCVKCNQQFTVVRHFQLCPLASHLCSPDQIYHGCGTSPRIPVPQVRKVFRSRPFQETCCAKETKSACG